MRRLSTLALATTALAFAGCTVDEGAGGTATLEEAAASINEADYMRKVGIIAHDSMMGRDTPSEGLDMTAAWIAAEFERYGLQPGGDDGTYLQRWPYRAYALDHDATTVTVEGGPALVLGEDLVHEGSPVDGSASGELVLLAGSEFDRAALETLDLEGRVVLLFPGSEEVERAARFFQGAEAVLRVVEMDDEAWNELATASRERTRRPAPPHRTRPAPSRRPRCRGSPSRSRRRSARWTTRCRPTSSASCPGAIPSCATST